MRGHMPPGMSAEARARRCATHFDAKVAILVPGGQLMPQPYLVIRRGRSLTAFARSHRSGSLAIVQPDGSQTRPLPILVHPRAPRGELLPALPERKPIFGNEAGSRTATPLARSLLLAKYHVSCPYWEGVVIRGGPSRTVRKQARSHRETCAHGFCPL